MKDSQYVDALSAERCEGASPDVSEALISVPEISPLSCLCHTTSFRVYPSAGFHRKKFYGWKVSYAVSPAVSEDSKRPETITICLIGEGFY